jgi:hypothetical protein
VTELRHGYTLADLHNLARRAVAAAGPMASDAADRYAEARSVIAVALYEADRQPSEHDLVRAGRDAIWALMTAVRHHHGYYQDTVNGGFGPAGSGPRFQMYWQTIVGPESSHEDRVVERLALTQILPTLTPRQRQVVAALAEFDDHDPARSALGMNPSLYSVTLSDARRRFLGLWHQGEAPSRPWGTDRRAGCSYQRRNRMPEVWRKRRAGRVS